MTLAPTYACFGCVPFAHNQRTRTYIEWACRMGLFGRCIPPVNWICSCPADNEDFTNPIEDEVCWYDPRIPESADFLGIVIRKVTGLRTSTFSRELADAIGGGSILQQPTRKGKQLVFEVLLYAVSQQGMNYGIQWMRQQIETGDRCPKDGGSCSSCQGQLLTVRVHCAPDALDTGLHSFTSAGAIDGFSLIEDEYPMGASCCNIVRAATFTLATESPDSFSTIPRSTQDVTIADAFSALGNCATDADLPTLDDVCCPICNIGCDSCTTDPACDCMPPLVFEPEVVGALAPCFSEPVCRCIGAAQVVELPAGYESTFRLILRAGSDPLNPIFQRYGMRNAVIRIFEAPFRPEPDGPYPLPDTLTEYEALIEELTPCAEMGVSWMPAGSELVIDGMSGRMWLKCDGRCVDHSSRVFTVSGDVFPLRSRCTELIATVEWDCMNVQDREAPETELSSFRVETYTGFTL